MAIQRVQKQVRLHGNRRGAVTRRSVSHAGSTLGNSMYDGNPYGDRVVARLRIQEALDPSKAPGKVRCFADMTPEEQAELRAKYGGR